MSWQQWDRERVSAPLEETGGWRAWAPAVALGFLSAAATQVALVFVLIWGVIAIYGNAKVPDTGDLVRVSIAAALVIGASCAVGSGVCRWRLRVRDLPERWARRGGVITAVVFAVLVLGVGYTLALRPFTVPIQFAGALAGSLLGPRVHRGASTPS